MSGEGLRPPEFGRKLYGRRQGRPLRPGQKALMDGLLPALSLPGFAPGEAPPRPALDPKALFPGARAVWMEIGFGGGEHLTATAAANPDVGLIGAEHFAQGVAKLLGELSRAGGAPNVRLAAGDARDVLDALPEASLERVYLLYPDPWPKKRHWRRRFISPENLDALARVIAPGGELRFATDIDDYADWTLRHIAARKDFIWTARRPSDWLEPWAGWPSTRYEAKALAAGRAPCYLVFQRMS